MSLLRVCLLGLALVAPLFHEAPRLARAGEVPTSRGQLAVGQEAPSFLLKTVNADLSRVQSFALKDAIRAAAPDGKIVLSFAASYCDPCRKELAALRDLADVFAQSRVTIVVIVTDTDPEGIEAMRHFTVDELKLTYPVVSDRFGIVARRYDANPLPTTVVVDTGGRVGWRSSGFNEDATARLAAALGLPPASLSPTESKKAEPSNVRQTGERSPRARTTKRPHRRAKGLKKPGSQKPRHGSAP